MIKINKYLHADDLRVICGEQSSKCYTVIDVEDTEVSDFHHTINELYHHRHALFCALIQTVGGWKSKYHGDGSPCFTGYFIAGTELNGQEVTYHLPDEYWDICTGVELDCGLEWDGHTSSDVLERIKNFAQG